jgi:hypothetical protein
VDARGRLGMMRWSNQEGKNMNAIRQDLVNQKRCRTRMVQNVFCSKFALIPSARQLLHFLQLVHYTPAGGGIRDPIITTHSVCSRQQKCKKQPLGHHSNRNNANNRGETPQRKEKFNCSKSRSTKNIDLRLRT